MADATITGNTADNRATVTNATDSSGTPSTNPANVTVTTSNATVSGAGRFYDVNMSGGNDALIASNMPYINTSGTSIGFEDISMGAGNDLVDLTRSAFRNTVDMGDGSDTLVLENSGGRTALMGTGNDSVQLDFGKASQASEGELSQKVGQPPTSITGDAGIDTLNLVGDWSLTLSSGNVTIDTNGDGIGDLVTNQLSASQYTKVVGFPAVLSGTVQWGGTVTLSNGTTVVSRATFSNFEVLEAVCFTSGTLIDTPRGPVAVEVLREGDMVDTRAGPRRVRWTGKRRLDVVDLAANPKLLPVCVPRGALGPDRPRRTLAFSPQHRLVVRSRIAERMFGEGEVLVAVKHLIGCNGIEVDGDRREVTYHHILLDEHAVVRVEGIEAETLFPGPQALSMLSRDALQELRAIFPDFDALMDPDAAPKGALPFVKGREGRALAARHVKSGAPLYA